MVKYLGFDQLIWNWYQNMEKLNGFCLYKQEQHYTQKYFPRISFKISIWQQHKFTIVWLDKLNFKTFLKYVVQGLQTLQRKTQLWMGMKQPILPLNLHCNQLLRKHQKCQISHRKGYVFVILNENKAVYFLSM